MQIKIGIIGLGYVGLPLAVAFSEQFKVVGYDTNQERIDELLLADDKTLEINAKVLSEALKIGKREENAGLEISKELKNIASCTVYIITVPTPIDFHKQPDLTALKTASQQIGSILKVGDYVIYESTVYPGCTEEVCIPILEETSGLHLNTHFFVGYSPERINPGDKNRSIKTIQKVTSGSSDLAATFIDDLYQKIITAGTFKAASIKVAEASKAIENAQRDLNISFINELSIIFDRIGIDTQDVLDAAATKWNFLKFKPGLVGGHCIGVDPYYLAHKARAVGVHPDVLLSGRRVNDQMGAFIAQKLVKLMIEKEAKIKGAKVLVLGLSFKENCPDTRNTKVVDVIEELISYGIEVEVYDPWVDELAVKKEFNITLLKQLPAQPTYSGLVLAVAHNEFHTLDVSLLMQPNGVVFDTKGILPREQVTVRL